MQQSYNNTGSRRMYFNRISMSVALIMSFYMTHAQNILQVLDADSGTPLAGVSFYLLPSSNLKISNENGIVSLSETEFDSMITLEIKSIGYENLILDKENFILGLNGYYTIQLHSTINSLREVLVLEDHAKHEHSLASVHLNEKYFDRNNAGTLSQSLRKVPGMQSLDMGPGIGKPVIRGLYGNRVIVNKDYIKQEGQQWGTDHGLEIDPFDARRIELVKGPASLQYGSDGLGGVLNILPNILPKNNEIEGQFASLYKSNNNHKASSLYLAAKKGSWFVTTRASVQDYEDYRVPAESFTYNGFELPIFNQRLKNTAGLEMSLAVTGGYQTSRQVTKLSYSIYDLKAGIFSGAVGIPRSYILTDDGIPDNIDIPFQEVNHQRWVMNHISFFGKNHFTLNLGYQKNVRTEHSLPESHSQFDIDPNDTRAVVLKLNTYTYETHFEIGHSGSGRSVLGSNGQYQINRREGYEFLLPDFQLWRTGIFYFVEQSLEEHWMVSAGARYDLGNNQNESFFLERRNRQGNIFATTSVEALNNFFHNWSGSIGAYYQAENPYIVRINLSKSFRIPYPNETSSNGIHHGNFRHELGNSNLKSEKGYQSDVSIEYNGKSFDAQISGFVNYFNGYIYLSPSPNFSMLPEAGLLFNYKQNDVFYTGFEAEYEYQVISSIKWRQAFEYVHSYNIQSQLALPFTPPVSILSEISYNLSFDNFELEGILSSHYFFANGINRVDRFEQPTPGYHLVDILFQLTSKKWMKGTHLQLQIQNLFNTAYLNHMSRYRLLSLPEQGRNFILTLKIPFSRNIPSQF